MKTGDKKQFTLNLSDLELSKDVDFIYIEGVGWVADRNVKTSISYAQLDELGYATGKPLTLDGVEYVCCMPTFGEWDTMMDYSEADEIWHWDDEFSFVYLAEFLRTASRASRGFSSPRSWYSYTAASADASLGFRPALKILPSAPLKSENDNEWISVTDRLPDDNIKQVLAYGNNSYAVLKRADYHNRKSWNCITHWRFLPEAPEPNLLPCPFCGMHAAIIQGDAHWEVNCCGCTARMLGDTAEGAAWDWNNRES